jgi:centrosomal protein CEP164
LKKLEELEDQIPDCNVDKPYHHRYPFTDLDNNCGNNSELDFFKHRILLERDSVMRAKESLKAQKAVFKAKQQDILVKHNLKTRHNADQVINVRCTEESLSL